VNWELVWDVRHSGSGDAAIGVVIAGAIFTAALASVWYARRRRQRALLGYFLFVMALVVVLAVGVTAWDQHRLAARLERGEVQTVEGFVSGHQIWRQARARSAGETQRFDTWETITVGGVQFTWSHDTGQAAFANGGTRAVAFRDGLPARVRWVEDVPGQAHQRRIVSLEIAAGHLEAQGLQTPYPSIVDPNKLAPEP
jgi:hypothetical protein